MKNIFAGRQDILEGLMTAAEEAERGRQVRLTLIGPRGIGKTALLFEFEKRIKARAGAPFLLYVDFERIVSSPEDFSLQYAGQLLAGYLRLNDRMALEVDYFDLAKLEEMGGVLGSNKVNESIMELKSRLNKDKKNQQRLVEIALSFPEVLSGAVGRKLLVVIDEFPFISDLDNFSGIKEIFGLFGRFARDQHNLCYVLSGSNTSLMADIVSSNALYDEFKPTYIQALNPREGLSLISKILSRAGVETSPDLNRAIFNYSFGHPFYMVHITQAAAGKALTAEKLSLDLVQKAMAEEILLPTGSIYLFCKYIYELALERAKSKSLLKAILHLLVQRDNLSLTEIGTLLNRTPPEASSLLHRLLEVDLVTKIEGRYSFRDRFLRLWLRFVEIKIATDEDYLWAKEKFIQDLKAEVGRIEGEEVFDEEEICEIIKTSFRGQRLPGRPFRREMDVVLVAASKVNDYTSKDGREILIEGVTASRAITSLSIGQGWIVAIRTKKAVGEPEVKRILSLKEEIEKDQRLSIDRMWIISEKGFTKKGVVLARENKALLSDNKDWQELKGLLE